MKKLFSLVLISVLTISVFGGEIDHPPVQPPECDPTVQTCPPPCNPAIQQCPESNGTQSEPDDSDTALINAAVQALTVTLSLL